MLMPASGSASSAWGASGVRLLDYRDVPEGAFRQDFQCRHVRARRTAQPAAYFEKIARLLKPGGLVMNHGITTNSLGRRQLGSGIGEFVEEYVFPGGELMHVSTVIAGWGGRGSRCGTPNACVRTTRAPCGIGSIVWRRSASGRRLVGEKSCAPGLSTWPARACVRARLDLGATRCLPCRPLPRHVGVAGARANDLYAT